MKKEAHRFFDCVFIMARTLIAMIALVGSIYPLVWFWTVKAYLSVVGELRGYEMLGEHIKDMSDVAKMTNMIALACITIATLMLFKAGFFTRGRNSE
ncbi:hypothetical protein [Vreelandella olivaria]|uniref:hypothetical protein n=1 Tax=Vreelandella olivaria TaxID=390919 RepID=UPI00201EB8EA|nr:hypothetical protein [Halomonas olivaria]